MKPCNSHAARARLLGLRLSALLALPALAFGQTGTSTDNAAKQDEPLKLDKFVVTGSFIPQASSEPVGPVAVFTESDIRSTGAFTPIQALRSLPSFIGNPGPTENDSNGGNGSTAVSLRGLGAGQTLVLIDGRVTLQFANIQLLPIEAIERVEVLRDGAGVIYGSAAIGGAVNIILKKNYNGSTLNVSAGGATRSPGGRETYQVSFATGVSNEKTSIVATGSLFHNRTIYANNRPNSAQSDNRRLGGTNGGSPTFPGVVSIGGAPKILRPNFPTNATPTAADYIDFDTNGFSSNQLFNFRQYSPSAPGQDRQSFMVSIDHAIAGDKLKLFGGFLYSRLKTENGLAPAPFALDVDPAGPAVGSATSFGPYNQGILNPATDFFRYRSVELGNRTNEQTFTDYRWQVGLRGQISDKWSWESAMTIEREDFEQIDGGVPSLPALDAEIQAGRFNPFAPAFSKGTATIGGQTYTWDNEKALQASAIKARQVNPIRNRFYDFRVTGALWELPAGDLGFAAGYETYTSRNTFDPDDLYASGSVLGLNSFSDSFTKQQSDSLFAEVKVPIIGEKNRLPLVHSLSVGALARREDQEIGDGTDSRSYTKTNPSVNLHWAPTADYLVRASWSKGFVVPIPGTVFGTPGTSNPTLVDPLGFPYSAQTQIVIRTNPDLHPAESKAFSVGLVGSPRNLLKNLSFSVDFYSIDVSGIVANNAGAILAANAAGQGPGFVPGNAATINPNAPFANLIRRSANGRLNSSGSFAADGIISKGAVLSDYLNIGSRKVQGLEYTATYLYNTTDWGRFKFTAAANQFLKFDQNSGPGLPTVSYLGRFVSTVGDPISPGSIPRWKGNFSTGWTYGNWSSTATFNYIGSYQDDPLFVLTPKMQAFIDAGTPKSDPLFAAFLSDISQPKVGGYRRIAAFKTVDLQTTYSFQSDNVFLEHLSVTLGATNVFDKLAPFAAGAFNDSFDTRTHNNIGRFVYLQLRKQF
ncbi:MAG: TonB-dependent receptor [Candidatus Didemnitutus sp.]|nr:TonB-dependent receptor [Candidatus Didemnitutus sp.]